MENAYRSMMVKISVPLLKKLKFQLDSAFLKRDPLLNSVFKHEAKELAKDTFRNTDKAKKYLSKVFFNIQDKDPNTKSDSINLLGEGDTVLKSVNLSLEKDTIEAIDKACAARNVPKDAFVNRVVYLLTADEGDLFDFLHLHIDPDRDFDYGDLCSGNYQEEFYFHASNIMDSITYFAEGNPFWWLRGLIDVFAGSGSTPFSSQGNIEDIDLIGPAQYHGLIANSWSNATIYNMQPMSAFPCYLTNTNLQLLSSFEKKIEQKIAEEREKQKQQRQQDIAKIKEEYSKNKKTGRGK